MRPLRSEVSGSLNYDEKQRLMSVRYLPNGPETGPGSMNVQDYIYNTPILIHSYEIRLVTNFIGVVYQNYGDEDDYNEGILDKWDSTSGTFYTSLKKYRVYGAQHHTVMKFSSSWNKKHRKWNIPPIKLGTPNAGGNTITVAITNQEFDSADMKYFAISRFRFSRLD